MKTTIQKVLDIELKSNTRVLCISVDDMILFREKSKSETGTSVKDVPIVRFNFAHSKDDDIYVLIPYCDFKFVLMNGYDFIHADRVIIYNEENMDEINLILKDMICNRSREVLDRISKTGTVDQSTVNRILISNETLRHLINVDYKDLFVIAGLKPPTIHQSIKALKGDS